MPCRCILAYMESLEVALLNPHFVDYMFPFIHFTPGYLLVSSVHHPLTGLLITQSWLSQPAYLEKLICKIFYLESLILLGNFVSLLLLFAI